MEGFVDANRNMVATGDGDADGVANGDANEKWEGLRIQMGMGLRIGMRMVMRMQVWMRMKRGVLQMGIWLCMGMRMRIGAANGDANEERGGLRMEIGFGNGDAVVGLQGAHGDIVADGVAKEGTNSGGNTEGEWVGDADEDCLFSFVLSFNLARHNH